MTTKEALTNKLNELRRNPNPSRDARLWLAIWDNNTAHAQVLLEDGANPYHTIDGFSAFHILAYFNHAKPQDNAIFAHLKARSTQPAPAAFNRAIENLMIQCAGRSPNLEWQKGEKYFRRGFDAKKINQSFANTSICWVQALSSLPVQINPVIFYNGIDNFYRGALSLPVRMAYNRQYPRDEARLSKINIVNQALNHNCFTNPNIPVDMTALRAEFSGINADPWSYSSIFRFYVTVYQNEELKGIIIPCLHILPRAEKHHLFRYWRASPLLLNIQNVYMEENYVGGLVPNIPACKRELQLELLDGTEAVIGQAIAHANHQAMPKPMKALEDLKIQEQYLRLMSIKNDKVAAWRFRMLKVLSWFSIASAMVGTAGLGIAIAHDVKRDEHQSNHALNITWYSLMTAMISGMTTSAYLIRKAIRGIETVVERRDHEMANKILETLSDGANIYLPGANHVGPICKQLDATPNIRTALHAIPGFVDIHAMPELAALPPLNRQNSGRNRVNAI